MDIWINVSEKELKRIIESEQNEILLNARTKQLREMADKVLSAIEVDGDDIIVIDDDLANELLEMAWHFKDI